MYHLPSSYPHPCSSNIHTGKCVDAQSRLNIKSPILVGALDTPVTLTHCALPMPIGWLILITLTLEVRVKLVALAEVRLLERAPHTDTTHSLHRRRVIPGEFPVNVR